MGVNGERVKESSVSLTFNPFTINQISKHIF